MKRPGAQADDKPTRTARIGPELVAMKRGMALLMLQKASECLAASEFRMTPAQAQDLIVRAVRLLED